MRKLGFFQKQTTFLVVPLLYMVVVVAFIFCKRGEGECLGSGKVRFCFRFWAIVLPVFLLSVFSVISFFFFFSFPFF